MRTVTYKSLLDGALKMRGEDPAQANTPALLAMAEFIDQAISDCHEYWKWPELERTEQRYFRPSWTAQAYASGVEVWDPTSLQYWVSNAPTTSADVPGVSTLWTELSLFNRYIDYVQDGQTPIEAVIEAWDADPRSTPSARRLYFTLNDQGVRFAADAPNAVWIEFRTRCPSFDWSGAWAAASYAVDAIVYHPDSGEVYQANQACVAADVPGVSAKWIKQDVPYIFRHAAKWKAYALWLLSDGQADKALIYDNNDTASPGKFQDALEDQVWQYTKLQGQTGRVNTYVGRR